jgi:hypothetical protein
VGLTLTDCHAEACTSRPLLLLAIGRQTRNAGQTLLTLTSSSLSSYRSDKTQIRTIAN